MTTINIQPKLGCIVRHPDTKLPLKADGESVILNTFWQRRINAGDVTIKGKAKTAPPASKEEKKPEAKSK